jgi:hypothetical protein
MALWRGKRRGIQRPVGFLPRRRVSQEAGRKEWREGGREGERKGGKRGGEGRRGRKAS